MNTETRRLAKWLQGLGPMRGEDEYTLPRGAFDVDALLHLVPGAHLLPGPRIEYRGYAYRFTLLMDTWILTRKPVGA